MYDILEARIEYTANNISRITVLVDCTCSVSTPYTDVRAIFATPKEMCGHMSIPNGAKLTEDLLQQVAAAGMETVDRDEIFPKWKSKYRKAQLQTPNSKL